MWFDVVWCGLMWFVMQSRHIQNQPKKTSFLVGRWASTEELSLKVTKPKPRDLDAACFTFSCQEICHSFSKRDLKVLDFPHCYQNLLDEMSWFWTFDSQRHGLALVVSSRVPLTDPLSRLCVPGSIITTASWHRITTKLQENHDRTIRGMIEWYRMISNDIEWYRMIHEVSRIIHFSESSIQRLSDYQSIQTDSPSFHWPGWPGWTGANVCGISLRCLDAAIFLEVSWQRKWQANTTVLPQDSK